MTAGTMGALAAEPLRAVIGRRLRTMADPIKRKLTISPRHQKSLRAEEHDPRTEALRELARVDHVIRAKLIVDAVPPEILDEIAPLDLSSWEDQLKLHTIIIRMLAGDLS